jgi:enoyl-CoA hydratase/carnithine racemase
MQKIDSATIKPQHFGWEIRGKVGIVTLNRPDRKNPLTFESYAELGETFRKLTHVDDIKVIVFRGEGENFCSGGDVHDIIGPLTKMNMKDLLAFTRMTGELIKSMRGCPQPIISAIDGVCVGAGACVAMASDLRYGTARSKVAFLFTKVGLAGCDMGACSILPRIIGQGRASELLYFGRSMSGDEALRWGFYNDVLEPDALFAKSVEMAERIAEGPTFAHSVTKTSLHQEWNMGVDEAIEAEAEAQAICMQTEDFRRAYHAFVAKQKPKFEGN